MLMSLRLKVEAGLITEVETLLIAGDSKIVGYQQEDLTQPSRLWSRTIPVAERNSRFELLAAADAYFRGFETNGTPRLHPRAAAAQRRIVARTASSTPTRRSATRCSPRRVRASMPGASRACRCATGAIRWWIVRPAQ